jgi:DNA-nicking Smr family endonuclease
MCRDARTTIDLHGMHVESAVSLVDEFVSIYLEVGLSRGMRRFQIITGAGLHSRGGRAKLKPAIQGLLRNRGVHFYDVNSGTIEIVIR